MNPFSTCCDSSKKSKETLSQKPNNSESNSDVGRNSNSHVSNNKPQENTNKDANLNQKYNECKTKTKNTKLQDNPKG